MSLSRGLHYVVTGYAVTRKTRLEVGRLVLGRVRKQGEKEGKKKKENKKRKKLRKSDSILKKKWYFDRFFYRKFRNG